MIWKTWVTLEELKLRNPGTIHEALGIEFTAKVRMRIGSDVC